MKAITNQVPALMDPACALADVMASAAAGEDRGGLRRPRLPGMSPGPADQDITFDSVATEYDATRGGTERARLAAGDIVPHLPAGTVLEIGVGTGIVARALAELTPGTHRLAGVDISVEMLRIARRRLPGRLVRASAARVPFPAGTFDGVVAVHVLHLVPDLERTLREAARVLRPGGRVVAIHAQPVPRDDELGHATRSLRELARSRTDTPEGVRAAGEAVGLRCVAQLPSSPRRATHTPASLADLISRRVWSSLFDLDDDRWRTHVEPALAALRALPDQHRPREQEDRMTVSALEKA